MATPFPLRGRRALPVLERLSPPASPQQAAPGLPTKRLKFLLGTEDNQGAMTIEAYLYRADEYRSTTANIPFPLPLMAGENPETPNERTGIRSRAQHGSPQHTCKTSGHRLEDHLPTSFEGWLPSRGGSKPSPNSADLLGPPSRQCRWATNGHPPRELVKPPLKERGI